MNVIMVMFDTLNRRLLQPYGSDETITPNFTRLARHSVKFNNSYVGSMPCMPARRELHTGRYNFLHRAWGPLEPFDVSMPNILKKNNIHSHLISDHGHYWETGGATYHCMYSTWDFIRGQEGDPWIAAVGGVEDNSPNFVEFSEGLRKTLYDQNLANRTDIKSDGDFPTVRTFDRGLEFLDKNGDKDGWFLQIESFSPHEPFMAPEKYKKLYPCSRFDKHYEWPDYSKVTVNDDTVEQVRYAHMASLSMCDAQLGRVLDWMDEGDRWDDTMLIVNTDHGYMLAEHGYFAKNYMPYYDEIVHTPLFIWDPRFKDSAGEERSALVQTIDLPATILGVFGLEVPKEMLGVDLRPVIEKDVPIRKGALFGVFGSELGYTDGKYVYLRAPRNNDELYNYTLMPTNMMEFFSIDELKSVKITAPFNFTKDVPVMKIATDPRTRCVSDNDYLFDLSIDPGQNDNIYDEIRVDGIIKDMCELLKENDAPSELFCRFDL